MTTAPPGLQPYANHHGDSGVTAWAVVGETLCVEFADGPVYVYAARDVGVAMFDALCAAARAGRGLSTTISREVGAGYLARFESRAQWQAAVASAMRSPLAARRPA